MPRTNKPLDLSPNEEKEFEEARICHICSEAFIRTDKRVRDHCPIMGKYGGAAHNNCNLNYRIPTFTPVFIHNNCHYDVHLFVKELCKTPGKMIAIPNTEQNYISFTKQDYTREMGANTNIRFLDF